MDPIAIVAIVVAVLAVILVIRSVKVIPQAQAAVIERLGRFNKVSGAGLVWLVPFLDRIRARIDLREQVVSFPPQPVITEDNLTVSIDTVVYFQVNEPRAAVYEIANYIVAVEQLTTTTLRNVVGGMNLEQTLTSRDAINGQLRGVLDEATGKWGIRVGRVELKAIEPPVSIQDAMEQQLRAERNRRAAILQAEGTKQSQILEAEGQRQAAILQAEGDAKAQVLRAEGEAQAIATVFDAIHTGDPDEKLLSYQYLQTLPKLAEGTANKLWMIPSEFTKALSGIAEGFTAPRGGGASGGGSAGGDFLDRISKLANESLANTATSSPAPSPNATAADIVPDSGLDERLAESDRSVDARLAAADEATKRDLGADGDRPGGAPGAERSPRH